MSKEDARVFAKSNEMRTEQELIATGSELIDKFKRASNILRNDGIDSGVESIYEFCSLIFIKKMSEKQGVPDIFRWRNWVNYKDQALQEQFHAVRQYLSHEYSGVLKSTKISKAQTLEKLIQLIDKVDFFKKEVDIKSTAYEYFLSRYGASMKSVLGQHFTPRHIIKLMVELIDPNQNDKIYDPYCGTGGMLVQTYLHIYKAIDLSNEKDLLRLRKECLFGRDIANTASQIAKMNMVLVSDGHSNIQNIDTNENPVDKEYDVVFTNIPFNLGNVSSDLAHLYQTKHQDSNVICLHHCIKALKAKGKAAIIVPETIVINEQYANFRKDLLNKTKIEFMIQLPVQTFKKYTNAKTCIMILSDVHVGKTKKIPFVEVKSDGFSSDSLREPIPDSDLPQIVMNRNRLATFYPPHRPTEENSYSFIPIADVDISTNGKKLRELVKVKKEKTLLSPTKLYRQPSISSRTHAISSRGESRLGKNIKDRGKGKTMIQPGDLVIATLHTQSGSGLFAISDAEYVATSQLVLKINPDVDIDYLCSMLEIRLPKLRLKRGDLVGRETYSRHELLNITIPYPPNKDIMKVIHEIKKKKSQVKKIDNEIESLKKLLQYRLEV